MGFCNLGRPRRQEVSQEVQSIISGVIAAARQWLPSGRLLPPPNLLTPIPMPNQVEGAEAGTHSCFENECGEWVLWANFIK